MQVKCNIVKPNVSEHSDECNLGPRLIDLPHIELFVLLYAGIHLVWLVTLGSTALHNVGNLDRFTRSSQFTYQGEDLVRCILNAVKCKKNHI